MLQYAEIDKWFKKIIAFKLLGHKDNVRAKNVVCVVACVCAHECHSCAFAVC